MYGTGMETSKLYFSNEEKKKGVREISWYDVIISRFSFFFNHADIS